MPQKKYDKILVVNSGSSSLKFMLFSMANEKMVAKGLVERIGTPQANIVYQRDGESKIAQGIAAENHGKALAMCCKMLADSDVGVLRSLKEVNAIGHRVVHGAEQFTQSVIITDEVIATLKECIELAPLHNPANLMGIEACRSIMPNIQMVGVFDTAFHQTMPKHAYLYGLSYEAYSKYRVRRYGFHGTSHKYVAQRYAELVGKDIKDLKIITCHLGNGSSITAVDGGKSVDTTMGFTPLEGVVMGTRSGDIDPAIVPYLMDKMDMSLEKTIAYLNKQCGVYGISGVSSDFRDLHAAANDGNERARMALDVFCYRIRKFIGAYAAAMGGVDAIVFTAGIGENDPLVRQWSVQGLEFIGAAIDTEANSVRGKELRISAAHSKVDIWCVPTNEELAIAKETYAFCK